MVGRKNRDLPPCSQYTANCESIGRSASFLTFARQSRSTGEVNNDLGQIVQTTKNVIPETIRYLDRLAIMLIHTQEMNEQKD